ncbi:MAG: putative tail tube protein [Prokaryotic dsDNA virus sp.]|jgi:predicted secreted protein|nr:MAG: putative tail tube protein [Prokaryotic dsDNA virus sp.]|tara:strand:- start:11206 stop:11610 length:405 start_codon:yes stop_codon:yes gene_type:complete
MAAKPGRALRIKYDSGSGAAVIAGARTDNFTINREGIDITDKDDAGVRTMLAETGTFSIDASVEGVLKDDTLLALAADPTQTSLYDFEIDAAGFGTFTGSWYLANFDASGAEGTDPTTFTANIQSSGTVTYTSA